MKNLLPAAVLAIVILPLTVHGATVTVYGKMHLSVDYVDSDSQPAAGQSSTNVNVSSNSSRIGFKGRENLGGGWKAIWQVEQSVDVDESGGRWATRNSFVGLSGAPGTALAGRYDTAYKVLGRKFDVFSDTLGDTRALLGSEAGGRNDFDNREDNSLVYLTPRLKGFSAIATYSAGLDNTNRGPNDGNAGADDNNTDVWSVTATYSKGPLFAGFAYENRNNAPDRSEGADGWRLGARYKLGRARIGAMWETINGDATTSPEYDRDGWTVFGTYDFGSNKAKLAYTQVQSFAGSSDTGGQLVAVGMDHDFSRRTKIYIQYSHLFNDRNATFEFGRGGYGDTISPDPGADPHAFTLGMVQRF